MMRVYVGVTKVYILPKAANVIGPVYMVWFVSLISGSTFEKKNWPCVKNLYASVYST